MLAMTMDGSRRGRPRGLSRNPQARVLSTREQLVSHVQRLLSRIAALHTVRVDRVKLARFIDEASRLYHRNSYHNWEHAVDVTHTIAWFATRPVFRKMLNPVDVFWLMIAAVVHDLDHPGHNNQWEISAGSVLAQRYQSISILEKHSIDTAEALLVRPECRFTDSMPITFQERGHFLLRELVLATDFAEHNAFVATFKTEVTQYPESANFEHPAFVLLVLKALLKAADIANVTKPYVQAVIWAVRVMQEFWAQGRRERAAGYPVGLLNDEERTTLKQAQVGFIRYVAMDLFTYLSRVEPETNVLVRSLQANLARYSSAVAVDTPQENFGLRPAFEGRQLRPGP